MAKNKLSELEHLRMLGVRSAAYSAGRIAALSDAVSGALEELQDEAAAKADKDYVDSAIRAAVGDAMSASY